MRHSKIIAALALVILLTGCSTAPRTKTIYSGETLAIYRTGRDIRVTSADTGKEYHFSISRARRKGSGVVAARTVIREDSFTITSIGSAWLIEKPLTRTFIRW